MTLYDLFIQRGMIEIVVCMILVFYFLLARRT